MRDRVCRLAAAAGVCLISIFTFGAAGAQATLTDNAKADCVYTAHKISILHQFEQMVGRKINCAQVFLNDDTWGHWVSPWFINYYNPDSNWSAWATAPGTNRQLIITQALAPNDVTSQKDWLQRGAAGAYTGYARTLAQHLVAAGLGSAVLRLASEANGTWNGDSFGTTPAQWAQWDQFWRATVMAMRSVPGAHFQFDFNIAALYRALPLSQIYPGDAYVDIIGIDAYDSGNIGNTPASRWNYTYNGPDGIKTVADFARAHRKPFSIPEWGVGIDVGLQGFGDDPMFVDGIASVVRNTDTAYQCYFYNYGNATQLANGPLSVAAYRRHFGPSGDSLGGAGGIVQSTAAAQETANAQSSKPAAKRRPTIKKKVAAGKHRKAKARRRTAGRRAHARSHRKH